MNAILSEVVSVGRAVSVIDGTLLGMGCSVSGGERVGRRVSVGVGSLPGNGCPLIVGVVVAASWASSLHPTANNTGNRKKSRHRG